VTIAFHTSESSGLKFFNPSPALDAEFEHGVSHSGRIYGLNFLLECLRTAATISILPGL